MNVFGKFLYQIHDGLSKEYAVSCKELGFLVEETKNIIPKIVEAHYQSTKRNLNVYNISIKDGVAIVYIFIKI